MFQSSSLATVQMEAMEEFKQYSAPYFQAFAEQDLTKNAPNADTFMTLYTVVSHYLESASKQSQQELLEQSYKAQPWCFVPGLLYQVFQRCARGTLAKFASRLLQDDGLQEPGAAQLAKYHLTVKVLRSCMSCAKYRARYPYERECYETFELEYTAMAKGVWNEAVEAYLAVSQFVRADEGSPFHLPSKVACIMIPFLVS